MSNFLILELILLHVQVISTTAWTPSEARTPTAAFQVGYQRQTVEVSQPFKGSSCVDLDGILTNAFQNNTHNKSLEIKLGEGCYNLSSNELVTVIGWTDFAIIGSGKDFSILNCGEGVGFTFLSSVGITLRSLKIVGCGRKQTSTSKNFTLTKESGRMSYLHFFVGMYFLSCGDVTMENVEVRESRGVGVVMYNCNGTNIFNSTNLIYNSLDNDSLYRSGGMAIEFTFCQPDDTRCKDSETSSVQVTQSRYTFFQCHFGSNGDDSADFNGDVVGYPHGTDHVAFGKGGGLSVIFKGRSSENSITIDNCTFKHNLAQWGGGLYTSFGDQSIDNKITVTGSHFNFNQNFCTQNSPKWMKSGGGAQIDFIYYPADDDVWPGYQPNVLRNSVSFYDTDFASNMACWGGAVSIKVSRESPGHSPTNSILFDNCHFECNKASIAAAVDVSVIQPDLMVYDGRLMKPVFKNCNFSNNHITLTDAANYQLAIGAVYANLVPLNFSGVTNFINNFGTALVVSGTYVSVSEMSEMIFERNNGRHGGALAFIGNSWLVAFKNVHVTFHSNSADMAGGAVYSVHYDKHDLLYQRNCFFQYYKGTLPPSLWNVTFRFTGNVANKLPNSIYTTSLLPCVWPNNSDHHTLDLMKTFCGHPWVFDNDSLCTSEIGTGPSNINLGDRGIVSIPVVPGWKTSFDATTLNDFGIEVPHLFTAVPHSDSGSLINVRNSSAYIADNTIVVAGVAGQHARLLLQTLDPKVISSLMNINIKKCPFGYKPQNCTTPEHAHMLCDCQCTNHLAGVTCNNNSHSITVKFGTCLTYWYNDTTGNVSERAVFGKCPYISEDTTFHFNVSYNSSALNEIICGKRMNRDGLLCSRCKDGLGVDVNDYRFPCVKCHARYSWFLFVLAELVPITLFFVIMAFFNISANSAPMNAFVFFSQMVTVPYFHNPYTFMFGYLLYPSISNLLEAFVSFPYAIWNLDFFATAVVPGFCLHKGLGTLEVIALKYLNAFLPLLLIIAACVLIKLHDQNYRVIRFLWYPFRKCSKRIYKNRESKSSIIDVFATFLLLSYSKVLYVSFSLFAPTRIYDVDYKPIGGFVFYFDASTPMFQGKYAVLSIIAFIIFVLFVVLPPLFLILYPMRCMQKVIGRLPFKIALRTFAEAFNGDFRDGTFKDGSKGDSDCRLYAGYYFLFRVVAFIVFVSELTWLEQYFIQQVLCAVCILMFAVVRPYKENFYNNLDTAMFSLLAVLNAFSLFNSQLAFLNKRINEIVFWINYILIFLPLVYIISYVVYLILLWRGIRCFEWWNKTELVRTDSIAARIGDIPSSDDEGEEDRALLLGAHNSRESNEDVPDRLVNPQNYNSRNLYRPPSENAMSPLDLDWAAGLQASSEKSYFYGKKDKKLVPYGTLTNSMLTERHSEPLVRHIGRSDRDSGAGDRPNRNNNGSGRELGSKRPTVRFKGVV